MVCDTVIIAAVKNLQAERARWFYWWPVGIGTGIAIYFALPFEPVWWLGSGPLIGITALTALRWRQDNWRVAGLACLSIILGFNVAQIQTKVIQHPILLHEIGPISVQGKVIDLDARPKDAVRLTLDQVNLWRNDTKLNQVRINIRKYQNHIKVGDIVRVKAVLRPLTEPAYSGSYDFALFQYFQGLSATGYSYGNPRVIKPAPLQSNENKFERWRQQISARIHNRLAVNSSAATQSILVALMTGEQNSVPENTTEDLKKAGIYHIISISGLHISFVAALAFVILRRLLALFPFLALRLPLKKIAAVCALLIVAAYTALVGAPVPTQRSALMLALAIIGILFDRGHGVLRPVAWAAMIILLVEPVAVLNVGVQLSFAAVTGLLVFYETVQQPLKLWWAQRPWWQRWMEGIFFALCSSLVATLTTLPIMAYYFHDLEPYGLITNILALPLTDFWIMSSICLAYILMPFGLDGWCLYLAAHGIDTLLWLAHYMASLPYATFPLPSLPLVSLPLFGIGLTWLLLWQHRWRFWGLGLIIVGFSLYVFVPLPKIMLAPNGQIAVLQISDGSHIRLSRAKESYYSETWGAYLNQRELSVWDENQHDAWLNCLNGICRYKPDNLPPVMLTLRKDFLLSECPVDNAMLLVQLKSTLPCLAADNITADNLIHTGTQSWFAKNGQWQVQTVAAARTPRPWFGL